MRVEKVLVESVQLTSTAASYYVTDLKAVAVIMQTTITNTGASDASATVCLAPPGTAAGPANEVFNGNVPAGQSIVVCPMLNHVLPAGGASIQAWASTAAALTFRVSGYERPA